MINNNSKLAFKQDLNFVILKNRQYDATEEYSDKPFAYLPVETKKLF